MKPLTHKQFDRLARELFSAVLADHGFTCEASRRCTFVRQIDADIYHIIMPDPGTRCAWYNVHVFPTSPRLQSDFESRFPDDLGNTLDVWGKLGDTGIGMNTQGFNCKYESNMRARFSQTVSKLLTTYAIPFLDQIKSYNDLLPHLRGPMARLNDGK